MRQTLLEMTRLLLQFSDDRSKVSTLKSPWVCDV